MAVAFIQEWRNPSEGTDNYDFVASKLDAPNNPPEGLIVHTAGRDGNGVWRIFEIWESSEHVERFREQRLMPIVTEMMKERPDATPPDLDATYELHDLVAPR